MSFLVGILCDHKSGNGDFKQKKTNERFHADLLGAAAEFERELTSERVRDGMARARNENKKIVRPVVLEQKGIDLSKIVDLKESGKSIREISQLVGIKRSTLHGILKSLSEKPTHQN